MMQALKSLFSQPKLRRSIVALRVPLTIAAIVLLVPFLKREWPCGLGAQVSGSDRVAHYEDFAREIGLAFQVQDDLLGIWGDPQVTGKPAGNDFRNHKKSLPVAYALDRSAGLRRLYTQAEVDVASAIAELDRVGAREYAEQLAAQHHQQALSALEATHCNNAATAALSELADQLLNRHA